MSEYNAENGLRIWPPTEWCAAINPSVPPPGAGSPPTVELDDQISASFRPNRCSS